MEESQSETYSDEFVDALIEEKKWLSAINAVLLQEAGGLVEIDKKTLLSIDLNNTAIKITYNEETETYTVEGVFNELHAESNSE
jgi:hypothetical protein